MPKPISVLEYKLGYSFRDTSLLQQALLHSSVSGGTGPNYQRLEFLGDRVLALIIASMLYEAFPTANEGDMACRLNSLVNRKVCAEIAGSLGISSFIRLSQSEEQAGGRKKVTILGDVIEAIIACVYIDGGLNSAKEFVERHWRNRIIDQNKPLHDAKTTLQEWAHSHGLPSPFYKELARDGPHHAPCFTIAAILGDLEPTEAQGSSKREGEQKAAMAMLIREKVWIAH